MADERTCTDATFLAQFEGFELLPHAARLLAHGRPVAVDVIAASVGIPGPEVELLLRGQPGTEWDEYGRLVGFGLTQRPTAHRFMLSRRTLYTWCATDTLFFPAVLGAHAVVESTCPGTGQPIRIEMAPNAVLSVKPQDAVVSQFHLSGLVADIRSDVCNHGHFFATTEAAGGWAGEHPNGRVLAVDEAFKRCWHGCKELGWLAPDGTVP